MHRSLILSFIAFTLFPQAEIKAENVATMMAALSQARRLSDRRVNSAGTASLLRANAARHRRDAADLIDRSRRTTDPSERARLERRAADLKRQANSHDANADRLDRDGNRLGDDPDAGKKALLGVGIAAAIVAPVMAVGLAKASSPIRPITPPPSQFVDNSSQVWQRFQDGQAGVQAINVAGDLNRARYSEQIASSIAVSRAESDARIAEIQNRPRLVSHPELATPRLRVY